MKPVKIKDRCTKKKYSKCDEVARLFDKIQIAFADALEADDSVESFVCNVVLDGLEEGEFTSDFVAVRKDGEYMVRECVWRKKLSLPRTAKLLSESYDYWMRRGVTDWGIVIEKEEGADGEK